jgi:hypothetical protein
MKKLFMLLSLMALFVNGTFAQKKVIVFDVSFEKGWEIISDVDQYPGKVIAIPDVQEAKSFTLWMGKTPIDLKLIDSSVQVKDFSITNKTFGILIKKFPIWIQMGYKNESGQMVLSRRYRYAKKI